MGLLDTLRRRIGNVKQALPFVKLFGYEKTYGKERVKDYDLMIENFKSWVYACAQRNAFSIAKCELKVYNRVRREGKWAMDEIDEHPFNDLMKKVNPFYNRFELWTLTTIFLELTGNSYWWIVPDQLGTPREIWNLPSNWMKIVPSKTTFIAGYVCQPPGQAVPIPFQEDEIIHFKYPSPFDLHYGTGPLIAAQYGVDLNNHLKTHGINYLMNNAQPSGALYTEDSLTDDQFKRLKDQWNREYKGSSNAGKMAILERGLKYQQIGQGMAELNFPDIARSVRDEILAIFGVPASKLGLVEDVNRANAEANDFTYQKETIEPRLILIEEKINEKLMPRYDVGLICKFVSPVPADKEFRLREQAEHIRSGYSSIDDERVKDDLKPYDTPETSMPLIPFSVVPAGEPRETQGALQDTNAQGKSIDILLDTKDAKARRARKWEIFAAMTAPQEKLFKGMMTRHFVRQHKEVMRNVANFKSYFKDVKAGLIASILLNMQEEKNKLKASSTPYIREALMSGANMAAQELGIDFHLIEPRVQRAIESRIDFFVEKTEQGTERLLTDELKEAIAGGENIESIARRMDKVFDYSEHFRSVRIARTEVIGGTNQGQLEVYKDAGVEWKQWITARDEKVRESHQIDGQTVGITEDFTTGLGNHMQYPGDRNSGADADDLVNCRCSVDAVRTKEG
jgi:HK97 family phage portal protein